MEKRETLLIPALLDRHWPLLRWAFETRTRRVVILDLCYPFILIAGQVLAALRSGKYDPEHTSVLISQAADACRGSCLIRLLRPVLDREGFDGVRLLSLNTGGIDRAHALGVTPALALRALAAAL